MLILLICIPDVDYLIKSSNKSNKLSKQNNHISESSEYIPRLFIDFRICICFLSSIEFGPFKEDIG